MLNIGEKKDRTITDHVHWNGVKNVDETITTDINKILGTRDSYKKGIRETREGYLGSEKGKGQNSEFEKLKR